MEPKEKARELIEKFRPFMYPFGAGSAYLIGDTTGNTVLEDAKKCALICIDEIIRELEETYYDIPVINGRRQDYWHQVKSEIEKYKT